METKLDQIVIKTQNLAYPYFHFIVIFLNEYNAV